MYNYCVIPWNIFLNLFKEKYESFIYYNKEWHLKYYMGYDIPIHLNFSPDNQIYFCCLLYNSVTFFTEEELNGIL